MIYLYIFLSVFAVSLISLIGLIALSLKKDFLQKTLFIFVGLAAGALFGDGFIHLIPEAFENTSNPIIISLVILSGILTFFILEKFLHWHHFHNIEKEDEVEALAEEYAERGRIKPLGILVLTSDAIHNLIDGVIIAASFFISVEIGIATTIAVMLHEIPQEAADFALLIHSGMKRTQALAWNFASALFAVLGAGFTILAGAFLEPFVFHVGAFAAGAFIYIAGSDLVPEIHKTRDVKKSAIQIVSIAVGILFMLSLTALESDEASQEIGSPLYNIVKAEKTLNQ